MMTGIILGMGSGNERRRYFITSSGVAQRAYILLQMFINICFLEVQRIQSTSMASQNRRFAVQNTRHRTYIPIYVTGTPISIRVTPCLATLFIIYAFEGIVSGQSRVPCPCNQENILLTPTHPPPPPHHPTTHPTPPPVAPNPHPDIMAILADENNFKSIFYWTWKNSDSRILL